MKTFPQKMKDKSANIIISLAIAFVLTLLAIACFSSCSTKIRPWKGEIHESK